MSFLRKILTLVVIFSWQGFAFTQNLEDTLNLKMVTVTESKILDSYKLTQIDSVAKKEATNLSELLNNNSPY